MSKIKKILKGCPLKDKNCQDCEQLKKCEELAAKNKKSFLGWLKKLFA